MFTVDPSTGDPSTIVIEGAFGLGEVVVGGQVEPDTYRVAKDGPRVADVRVGVQTFMIATDRERRAISRVDSRPPRAAGACSTTTRSLELARLGLRVEAALRRAAGHRVGDRRTATIFLVQSRPITTLGAGGRRTPAAGSDDAGRVLVRGLGASPGRRRRAGARACARRPRARRCNAARCSSRR